MPFEDVSTHTYAWGWRRQENNGKTHFCTKLAIPPKVNFDRGDIVLWAGQFEDEYNHAASVSKGYAADPNASQASDKPASKVAHHALRHLLGEGMGCPKSSLSFEAGLFGKPYLIHRRGSNALDFNISHAQGRVLVGIAAMPIGVDTEFRTPFAGLLDIARMYFDAAVITELIKRSGDTRTALFYRHWCLGEAFTKLTGQGIYQGFDTFAFESNGAPYLTRVAPGFQSPSLWGFAVADSLNPNYPTT